MKKPPTKPTSQDDQFFEALSAHTRADYLEEETNKGRQGLSGWTVLGLVILSLIIILLWLSRGLNFKTNPSPPGTVSTQIEL